ncbi:CRISPR-associated helicase Cas3' [Lactobacillus agrestimuris]|uniref:CRISPR-associated helicase Cas3' n=1 Tax=Lactobacillus agrestimuris TaxID=2941328 RepID=UPI00204420BA|nr:CRISPR-associated helicase Cas3' [Lactobacillus agrestimuris]
MNELSKEVKALWGKKNVDDNGQALWLPLVAHLIDTKNVINFLYNNWLDRNQREILCRGMSEDETMKLVNFLGCVHDFGKATPAFQTKPSRKGNKDLDNEISEKLIMTGFKNIDSAFFDHRNKSPHNIAGETLLEYYGLNESIGAIIGGHHGKPQKNSPIRFSRDFFDIDQLSVYTENYYQNNTYEPDSNDLIGDKWVQIQKELLNYILELCDYESLEEVPKVTQEKAVILEGLLIMADWLASSEYFDDNKKLPMFNLIDLDQGLEDIDFQSRFEVAMINWLQNDNWSPQYISNINQHYEERWGFKPREIQARVSEKINETIDPGMIIVEAPMGIGKSEIAMTAVEQLAFSKGLNGLFFGLPTQATSDAMFVRIEDWLKKIAKSESENLSIKLMHSKAQFNKEYTKLPVAENVDFDELPETGSVVVNSWFSGKKSILSEFTVGTIDQLLLMSLKQKHLALRHLGISGKVVVIDEIHSYSIYMNSYLQKALEWLGAYHVPVIALSATLPTEKRKELLEAYSCGKNGTKKFIAEEGWQDNQSYPLLSILDGNKLKQYSDFPRTKDTKVLINRLSGDEQEIVNEAMKKIQDGGIAGIIVDTVKKAQTIEQLIPKDISSLVLHSAFLAPDRAKIEEKLQELIGKNGQRPEKMIIVGTQVLEQSLDIDFDILFTDIAPMDLILQRIGRLHRHNIDRPEKLKKAQVYITGIKEYGEYGDAIESIYSQYLLMKTDHFLKSKIEIPSDISKLVQKVYDGKTDKEVDGIRIAKIKFKRQQKRLKDRADQFQIATVDEEETIHGWLSNDFINGDIKAQAAVRDTQETMEVLLLKRTKDGSCLLDGRPLDSESVSSKEIAKQIIRLPHAVTNYKIDDCIDCLEKKTRKLYPSWQEDIWLKEDLVITLDENNETEFNGWKLKYSSKLGLSYEKEDED